MIRIIKKPADPIATRISAGGIGQERYIVYRGNLQEVKAVLIEALSALNSLDQEPETDFSEFGQ